VQSSPKAGCLRLVVCRVGEWLEMSVSDDGQGVSSTEVEQVFFAERSRVHALSLLRRRLAALFGRSFRLEICSEIGQGTTVRMRIPLLRQRDAEGSLETILSRPGHLASGLTE
jgi:sensor histidine kinase YesM